MILPSNKWSKWLLQLNCCNVFSLGYSSDRCYIDWLIDILLFQISGCYLWEWRDMLPWWLCLYREFHWITLWCRSLSAGCLWQRGHLSRRHLSVSGWLYWTVGFCILGPISEQDTSWNSTCMWQWGHLSWRYLSVSWRVYWTVSFMFKDPFQNETHSNDTFSSWTNWHWHMFVYSNRGTFHGCIVSVCTVLLDSNLSCVGSYSRARNTLK